MGIVRPAFGVSSGWPQTHTFGIYVRQISASWAVERTLIFSAMRYGWIFMTHKNIARCALDRVHGPQFQAITVECITAHGGRGRARRSRIPREVHFRYDLGPSRDATRKPLLPADPI